jgi:nuclear transport factor 2 (NTF2) superfamily protein
MSSEGGAATRQHVNISENGAIATIRRTLPPFTRETAIQKVRLAEDAWNSRDPGKVALAYSLDSRGRNRSEFVNGRQDIIAFLNASGHASGRKSWITA